MTMTITLPRDAASVHIVLDEENVALRQRIDEAEKALAGANLRAREWVDRYVKSERHLDTTTIDRNNFMIERDAAKAQVSWLDELRQKLEVEKKTILDNLTATQTRCTQLLDENRGHRVGGTALGPVLGDVVAERYRQDVKFGALGEKDLKMPDRRRVHSQSFLETIRDVAQRECDEADKSGVLTWEHIIAEEVTEAIAESDPVKLRAELVQVAAVAVKWIQALDLRALAKQPTISFVDVGAKADSQPIKVGTWRLRNDHHHGSPYWEQVDE